MNWDQLLSAKRFTDSAGSTRLEDIRSQFQRDYDRIIFSSPFRRLQNKTQVFPLPGSVFVHNRLTHSLEVASVGRSIARSVALELQGRDDIQNKELLNELGAIVAAACLAHDLGNPPFGHSGEKAISSYFTEGEGKKLEALIAPEKWSDLIDFEGNANALRILTHQFNGRRKGGFALTYATLASLLKYPYPSSNNGNRKKYGFFQSEKETFLQVAEACGLVCHDAGIPVFARHPLVFLVEAADDISYLIMDIEDAHKLRILSTAETETLLRLFFDEEKDAEKLAYIKQMYQEVTDTNERIAFLRAMAINLLVQEISSAFMRHYDAIMAGNFEQSLVSVLDSRLQNAFETCRHQSVKKIYQHPDVVKIELTGFNVLGKLMEAFAEAVLHPNKTYNKKLLSLLPQQFHVDSDDLYHKLQSVVDFVSGMTDLYAMQLYRDLQGI
jgi:dGTPase